MDTEVTASRNPCVGQYCSVEVSRTGSDPRPNRKRLLAANYFRSPSTYHSGLGRLGNLLQTFIQPLRSDRQQNPDTAERKKCLVDVGPLVVPDAQMSELIQPGERFARQPNASGPKCLCKTSRQRPLLRRDSSVSSGGWSRVGDSLPIHLPCSFFDLVTRSRPYRFSRPGAAPECGLREAGRGTRETDRRAGLASTTPSTPSTGDHKDSS